MPGFVAVTDSVAGPDLTVERDVLAGMRVAFVPANPRTDLIAAVRAADALLCMHVPIDRELIQGLQRCRVIARYGTGLDNIDRAAAAAAGIAVAGVHDYCTEEVADHTMALLLAWNRKLREYDCFVREERWNQRPQTTGQWGCGPVTRLSTQTLGLVGFGHIAQAVAQRARAFGLTVLAWGRNPDASLAAEVGVELTDLDTLLPHSDYISLHVPLVPETRGMIDTATLRRMKSGAVLINTARGGLVDEVAVSAALHAGHLGGALLDVYVKSPLPKGHPFRALENTLLTPHVGFYSEESLLELRRRTAEIVRAYLSGETCRG